MPKRKPNPIIKTDSSFSTAHGGRFFFNANIGYGLSAAPQLLDFNVNNANNVGVGVYGTYGRGFLTNIRLGYTLNNHLAFDLGFSYLVGQTVKANSSSQYYTEERSQHAYILNINPTFMLMQQHNKLGIYARSGILIGLTERLIYEESEIYTSNSNGQSSNQSKTIEYYGGVPIGFSNAMGLSFMLSPNLYLISELNLITQNWAPRKSKVTEYTENGIDKLNTLPNKEITYYGSGSNTSSSIAYKNYLPMSSFSFNVGVKFEL